jgi:hypothetical protein
MRLIQTTVEKYSNDSFTAASSNSWLLGEKYSFTPFVHNRLKMGIGRLPFFEANKNE